MRPVGGHHGGPVRRAPRRGDEPRSRGAASRRARSARTSTTASTSSRSRCRRCARAARDVLLLAQTFLEQFARQHGKAVQRLSLAGRGAAARLRLARQRPRAPELHRARGRAGALRGGHRRGPARAGARLPRDARARRRDDPSELVPLAEVERRYVERVHGGGGRQQAAGRAGARARSGDALPKARTLVAEKGVTVRAPAAAAAGPRRSRAGRRGRRACRRERPSTRLLAFASPRRRRRSSG